MIAATERPSAVERARSDLRDAQQAVRDAHTARGLLAAKFADAETALSTAERRAVAAVSSPGDDDAAALGDTATARVRRDALVTALALADATIAAAERAVVQSQTGLTQAEAVASFDIVRATLPELEAVLKAFAIAYKTLDSAYSQGMQLRGPQGSNSTPRLYLSWQIRKALMKLGVDLHMQHTITPSEPFDLGSALEERMSA